MAHDALYFNPVGRLGLKPNGGPGLNLRYYRHSRIKLELDLYVMKKTYFLCQVSLDCRDCIWIKVEVDVFEIESDLRTLHREKLLFKQKCNYMVSSAKYIIKRIRISDKIFRPKYQNSI